MHAFITFLFVVLFFWACGPTLYIPQSADAETQVKLLTGRKLYIEKCSGCHNLFLPQQFTAVQWELNLNEMQERSTISNLQKELIWNYLVQRSKAIVNP